jgi:hypothetical protein
LDHHDGEYLDVLGEAVQLGTAGPNVGESTLFFGVEIVGTAQQPAGDLADLGLRPAAPVVG